MHNPPHPGRAQREFLGDLTVTEAASRLGVTRTALSRILNGSAGISADMALRLGALLDDDSAIQFSSFHSVSSNLMRRKHVCAMA